MIVCLWGVEWGRGRSLHSLPLTLFLSLSTSLNDKLLGIIPKLINSLIGLFNFGDISCKAIDRRRRLEDEFHTPRNVADLHSYWVERSL